MKPKAVLAYCREKGIRTFDLRFSDLDGNWRHITLPVSSLNESSFDEGFGQEIETDPRSMSSNYSILLPHSDANYLDPFTSQPTLILVASIQDLLQREESAFDVRHVATKALRYLNATSIADDVNIRTTLRFGIPKQAAAFNSQVTSDASINPFDDKEYLFRCNLTDKSLDSGVNIERHYSSYCGSSDMVVRSASILEACDDIMMLRYLFQHSLRDYPQPLTMEQYWSSSQWNLIRNSEPLFNSGPSKGMSETGLYALGGILKHAQVLTAIFMLPWLSKDNLRFPFQRKSEGTDSLSLCRTTFDAQSPRTKAIEVRGIPSLSNHYLGYSAILMAMIDGIQNKWVPPSSTNSPQLTQKGCSEFADVGELAEAFHTDWDFLARGDVFHEDLILAIRARLNGPK